MIVSILILIFLISIPVAFYLTCAKTVKKSPTPKPKFWARQFQPEATSKQKVFDWIFGVALPVICFVFDPIVFKGNGVGQAILGNYRPFAYILSFLSVMAMSAWLIWGAKLKWFGAFLAGAFAVGGMISLAVGIILSPFSLIGLVFFIGILGFTPLISAIVFWRNAVRAFYTAKPYLEKQILAASMATSAIFCLTLPFVTNLEIGRSLEKVKTGDAETIRAETFKLKIAAPLTNFDNLALFYLRSKPEERNNEKMQAIVELYQEITGENLETKASVLMD